MGFLDTIRNAEDPSKYKSRVMHDAYEDIDDVAEYRAHQKEIIRDYNE